MTVSQIKSDSVNTRKHNTDYWISQYPGAAVMPDTHLNRTLHNLRLNKAYKSSLSSLTPLSKTHKIDKSSKSVLQEPPLNEVDGISNRAQLALVESLLLKHGGQLFADVWQLGLNTALRITDLLSLTMEQVRDRETLTLTEGKTGKPRTIKLNPRAREVIARRLADYPDHAYLFQSTSNRAKSVQKPINRTSVAHKFQEIGEIVGVSLGTHSMRKSRGAVMFNEGVPLELISKVLNHSSPGVTMRYIGLTKQTVADTYDDYVI